MPSWSAQILHAKQSNFYYTWNTWGVLCNLCNWTTRYDWRPDTEKPGCGSSFPQTKWIISAFWTVVWCSLCRTTGSVRGNRSSLQVQCTTLLGDGSKPRTSDCIMSCLVAIGIHSPTMLRYQGQAFHPPFWGWRWNPKTSKNSAVVKTGLPQNPQAAWFMYTSFTKIGRDHSQFTGGRR